MAEIEDVALFSLAALLGTIGVSITGFGHAILFIFVWQIAVISGFTSDFKFSVFIQVRKSRAPRLFPPHNERTHVLKSPTNLDSLVLLS